MKKLKKILIILFGLFPIIVSAQENETKWRWYTFIETNIHYESEVENICEYFENYDKNTYIYTDWKHSLDKPEEKEYREIIKSQYSLGINRNITNILKIKTFENDNRILKIHELAILDENNNKVDIDVIGTFFSKQEIEKILDDNLDTFIEVYSIYDFSINFSSPIDIKNITIELIYTYDETFVGLEFDSYLNEQTMTNSFASYSTDVNKKCEDGKCTMKINIRETDMNNEDVEINLNLYKYRDKLYKCFTKEKLYVPGFYSNLEGFIKDEENYEITKTEIKELENPKYNNIFKTPVNSKLEAEEQNNDDDPNTTISEDEPLAIITKKDNKKNSSNDKYLYIILLILLICLAVLVTFTKFVKKSRTN